MRIEPKGKAPNEGGKLSTFYTVALYALIGRKVDVVDYSKAVSISAMGRTVEGPDGARCIDAPARSGMLGYKTERRPYDLPPYQGF